METAKVLKDSAGKSKGVGFVQFSEPEDAEAAITGMNGKTVRNMRHSCAVGRQRVVEVLTCNTIKSRHIPASSMPYP